MLQRKNGFTLLELIIVMVIFMLVIMATTSSFNVLLTQMSKVIKSEESNIEGVVGLEMLRHDLQQAGYGLPEAYMSIPPQYIEAKAAPADDYNDAPNGLPRAVVAGNNIGAEAVVSDGVTYNILDKTDYIGLKATTLGMNNASQKWTYMPYSSGITFKQKPRIWPTASQNLTNSTDRVIMIKKSVVSGQVVNQMVYDTSTPDIYWVNFNSNGFAPAFTPVQPDDIFYIYGIRSKSGTSGDLGMPFNRADYFIAKPNNAAQFPAFCAPNTGILYKATINHEDGLLSLMPILDCAADMQIVLGWRISGEDNDSGAVDTWSTPEATTVTPSANVTAVQAALADPAVLRKRLKVIKIYILAQNGKLDTNYMGPASMVVGASGEASLTKTFNFTAEMRNYRWKLYQVIVSPKNLTSNQ